MTEFNGRGRIDADIEEVWDLMTRTQDGVAAMLRGQEIEFIPMRERFERGMKIRAQLGEKSFLLITISDIKDDEFKFWMSISAPYRIRGDAAVSLEDVSVDDFATDLVVETDLQLPLLARVLSPIIRKEVEVTTHRIARKITRTLQGTES